MKKLLFTLISLSSITAMAQSVIPLGSATNMFTLLESNSHCVAVDNPSNSVVFIHRNNATKYAGTYTGQYRYDISVDGGATFLNDQGILNPTAIDASGKAGRYPQVVINNPSQSSTASNLYMQYLGSYHNGASSAAWTGVITGTAKMDNSTASFTENYTPMNGGDFTVATSFVPGKPGTFWTVCPSFDNAGGAYLGDIVVMKGTATGNNVSWAVSHKLTPQNWDLSADGTYKLLNQNIAFDKTGMKGWISFQGDIRSTGDPKTDQSYDPIFYRTLDGGDTWQGPMSVNLNLFDSIPNWYALPAATATANDSIYILNTAFESDLTVDAAGNPHLVYVMGLGSSEEDINAGSGYSVRANNAFDLTYDGDAGKFKMVFFANVEQLRADSVGTSSAGGTTANNSMDNRIQVSRSDDGNKVFYAWLDNSDTIASATDRTLFVRGYDATTKSLSQTFFVSETAWPTFGKKAYFFTVPPVALSVPAAGATELPIVVAKINPSKSIDDTSAFFYLNGLQIPDDNFTLQEQSTLYPTGFVVPFPNSINETLKGALQVSPNPAKNNILITNLTNNGNEIRIYGINGEVVYAENVDATLVKNINISKLTTGVYTVELVNKTGRYTTKLIKE